MPTNRVSKFICIWVFLIFIAISTVLFLSYLQERNLRGSPDLFFNIEEGEVVRVSNNQKYVIKTHGECTVETAKRNIDAVIVKTLESGEERTALWRIDLIPLQPYHENLVRDGYKGPCFWRVNNRGDCRGTREFILDDGSDIHNGGYYMICTY